MTKLKEEIESVELSPDEFDIAFEAKVKSVKYIESLIDLWQKFRYLGRNHILKSNLPYTIDDGLHGDVFDLSIQKL
jgi:hypothetical protein